MDNSTVATLLLALVGGGFMTGLAALLTVKSGRERSFSERVDSRLTRLEAENDELDAQVRIAEERIHRLRLALLNAGINPDDVDPLGGHP